MPLFTLTCLYGYRTIIYFVEIVDWAAAARPLTHVKCNLLDKILFRTFNQCFLALDDFVTERPLLVVLEYEEVSSADLVFPEQGFALHLNPSDLQLVDLAK